MYIYIYIYVYDHVYIYMDTAPDAQAVDGKLQIYSLSLCLHIPPARFHFFGGKTLGFSDFQASFSCLGAATLISHFGRRTLSNSA